jgi:hypothetical protein
LRPLATDLQSKSALDPGETPFGAGPEADVAGTTAVRGGAPRIEPLG